MAVGIEQHEFVIEGTEAVAAFVAALPTVGCRAATTAQLAKAHQQYARSQTFLMGSLSVEVGPHQAGAAVTVKGTRSDIWAISSLLKDRPSPRLGHGIWGLLKASTVYEGEQLAKAQQAEAIRKHAAEAPARAAAARQAAMQTLAWRFRLEDAPIIEDRLERSGWVQSASPSDGAPIWMFGGSDSVQLAIRQQGTVLAVLTATGWNTNSLFAIHYLMTNAPVHTTRVFDHETVTAIPTALGKSQPVAQQTKKAQPAAQPMKKAQPTARTDRQVSERSELEQLLHGPSAEERLAQELRKAQPPARKIRQTPEQVLLERLLNAPGPLQKSRSVLTKQKLEQASALLKSRGVAGWDSLNQLIPLLNHPRAVNHAVSQFPDHLRDIILRLVTV